MADQVSQRKTTNGAGKTGRPPRTWQDRLRSLGPGMVLAVTSVGAGDMVTTLNSSASFGLALAWTIVLGIVMKFVLTEAVGRLQLSSDRTLMSHMASIGGPVLPVVYAMFMIIIGLFYGAGLSMVAAIAVVEMVPAAPLIPTAIAIAVASGVLVGWGRYSILERIMVALAAVMFASVLVVAVMAAFDLESPRTTFSTLAPSLPGGSMMAVLALIGGVGGAGGILAYGYWVREKQWSGREWLPHLRTDAAVSYAGVLVFALAMTFLGTALLHGTDTSIEGTAGVAAISQPVAELAGATGRLIFLLCLFVVVFSSILGGFSAIAYITADSIRVVRGIPDSEADRAMSTSSPVFRLTVLYCVVTSVTVMFTGRPVLMVLIYATLSAFILPTLAGSLLVVLNRNVSPAFRNGRLSNTALSIGLLLFGALCVNQVVSSISAL